MKKDEETHTLLRALTHAQTRREIWDTTLEFYTRYGIKRVNYQVMTPSKEQSTLVQEGFPAEFVESYISGGLDKNDPILERVRRTGAPVWWDEVRGSDGLTTEHVAFLDFAKSHGMTKGLSFAVYGEKFSWAHVGLGFGDDTPKPDPHMILAFKLVAQAGHDRYLELTGSPCPLPDLSPRETEVLEWMAKGKSNSVISQIMDLSPHTVDTHVRKIYAKLGVADRTTATIQGLGRGILQYPDILT